MKVLVVDDSEDICFFLEYVLTEEGYEVVTVSNGLEAIQTYSRGRFDIILTEICLPGINGNILCKQFKLTRKQPIIAMTKTSWLADDGFDYVLSKPFNMEALQIALESCSSPHKTQTVLPAWLTAL